MDGPTVEVIWLRRNGVGIEENLEFSRQFLEREFKYISIINDKMVDSSVNQLFAEINKLCNSSFSLEDLNSLKRKAKIGYDEVGPILEQELFMKSSHEKHIYNVPELIEKPHLFAPKTYEYRNIPHNLLNHANAAWIVAKYKGIILGGINFSYNNEVDFKIIQKLKTRTRFKKIWYNNIVVKDSLKFARVNSITKYSSCKLAEHCMGIKFSIADLLISRCLRLAEENGIEIIHVPPFPIMEGILKKRFGFQDFCEVFECLTWGKDELYRINEAYLYHHGKKYTNIYNFDNYKALNVNNLVYLLRPIKGDIISLRAKELWGYGTKPSLHTRKISEEEKEGIIRRFNVDLDARLDKEYEPLDEEL